MLAKTDAQREKLARLFEFTRLYAVVKRADNKEGHILCDTYDAKEYLKSFFADNNEKEHVAAVFLDARHRIIATKIMSSGTVNQSVIQTREIAREALFHNAVSVILSHNHPSGAINPSKEDIHATNRVKQCLHTVDVNLLDHIIIAGDSAVSLADLGHINTNNLAANMDMAASPVSEGPTVYANKKEKEVINQMDGNESKWKAPISNTLEENEHVKELLSTLHNSGKDASGLLSLLSHVNEMENFIKHAEGTISEMKSQLAEMKEVQNHPVKAALQNTIKNLERLIAEMRKQLSDLKNKIVEGSKKAVAEFKDKGIMALDKLVSFFNIKGDLQAWKKIINSTIRADDKAVAKIQAFSDQYHSTGLGLKNMARIAVGKPPIDEKKEAGKLAKTLSAPYKMQKSALTSLRNSIDKAISNVERLEKKAATKQAERAVAKKPSLIGQLHENLAIVEQRKREAPVHDRAKAKGAEL
jgi:hypothetical protein